MFVFEGSHIVNTSKRVLIESEPMTVTHCGLLLDQGQLHTGGNVFFVASVATVESKSWCPECKSSLLGEKVAREAVVV